jgi:glycosyltransferase involved in cell wall biosynthesis
MTLPVLFDARSALMPRPGGWERYSRELVARFDGQVLTTPERPPRNPITSIAWEWTALPWRARQAELVHLPAYPPTPLVRGNVLYTLHDAVWLRYPQWQSRGGRAYYRHVARQALRRVHVVCGSHAVAEELAQDFDIAAHVISYGVTSLPPAEPEVRARPYLLSVGTVEPRKNLARLVKAYQASSLPGEVDLVLVGRPGWGELPPGVVYLGNVDDTRLSALYRGARAVAAASLYEGFGLPVAEGILAGVPVVCSDIPSFREATAGEARFFDPLSVPAITAALEDAALGLPVPKAVTDDRYSWDRCATEHLALYRRLLGGER